MSVFVDGILKNQLTLGEVRSLAKDNIKSVLVVGLGRFGYHAAAQFNELGIDVMGIDKKEDRVTRALTVITRGLIGDVTNREFMLTLGINNFDLCVVTIAESFQDSLEATWLLKELGARKVIARAGSEIHEKFLLRNGADETIYPERQDAHWLANRFSSPHIFDYTRLDKDNAIFEIEVPGKWVGKSLVELNVRREVGINIIGIRTGDGQITTHVDPDQQLKEGDRLVVSGEAHDILALF